MKCDGRSDLGSQCFVMEKKKKRVCFTYRFEVLGVRLADRFEWGGASVGGGSGRRPSSPLSTEKAPLLGRRRTDLPGLCGPGRPQGGPGKRLSHRTSANPSVQALKTTATGCFLGDFMFSLELFDNCIIILWLNIKYFAA